MRYCDDILVSGRRLQLLSSIRVALKTHIRFFASLLVFNGKN